MDSTQQTMQTMQTMEQTMQTLQTMQQTLQTMQRSMAVTKMLDQKASPQGQTNAVEDAASGNNSLDPYYRIMGTFSWAFKNDDATDAVPIMRDLTRMLKYNKHNNGCMCLLKTDEPNLYVVAYNGEKPDANVNDYIGWRRPVPYDMLENVRKGVNSINSILSSDCNEFVVIQVEHVTGKFPYNFTFMRFYTD